MKKFQFDKALWIRRVILIALMLLYSMVLE